MRLHPAHLFLFALAACCTAPAQTVADLERQLGQLTVDPGQTYHVRDVRLRKGDVSIYLNEGVIAFASPVGGHIVAALFTTEGVDAGDAEILIMPPQPAERASLASFAKTPNLDEHFASAVFFFTDQTREEILSQIADPEHKRTPNVASDLAGAINPVLRANAEEVNTRLLGSLLSGAGAPDAFFFSIVLGRDTGPFSFLYDPSGLEPVIVGATRRGPPAEFQLWTAYRPRQMPPLQPQPLRIAKYVIDADIKLDLSLHASASFDWTASADDGRALRLFLSRKLKVESATLDGSPVEFVHPYTPDFEGRESDTDLLIAPATPVVAGRVYRITVRYSGLVIRQVGAASYLVGERNVWYPHIVPMSTTFDLTLRCPAQFDMVATGDLVSNQVANGIRTVHRITARPEQLAGFNFGEYRSKCIEADGYRIECYSAESVDLENSAIPEESAGILKQYTEQWGRLPLQTLAITPIPGYFGQGFPGLIYLSETAYVSSRERPADVRNARGETFFGDVLLPHELAHQWWGNLVSAASYRSDWLMESMANYSALELMESHKGQPALDALLGQYKHDLENKMQNGSTLESVGPVDFGARLLDGYGQQAWLAIEYEKGTWILHMLRERLGAARFRDMQTALLKRYAGKAIDNEQFREVVSEFVPAGQPDPKLTSFFDTWVYGTGVPAIEKKRTVIRVTQVDEDFTFDMPLSCKSAGGAPQTRWVHLTQGDNQISSVMGNCQLPDPSQFLYTSNESKP